jgi:hypothetical protein
MDMLLTLTAHDHLRLSEARGRVLHVVSGRVWITEEGSPGDWFLDAGRAHRVLGNGLVLIASEGPRERAAAIRVT